MPRPAIPDIDTLLSAAVSALGGAERPGQVRMATAVSDALITGRHLAVQAGTGTGKSLAYLIPAIAHALQTDNTVIVSTATLALQRQLTCRDLPLVVQALTPLLPRPFTFAILKGRSNYLCLNAVNAPDDFTSELIPKDQLTPIEKEVRKLSDWSKTTVTGDRDDVPFDVTDQVWRRVSVTAKDCPGAHKCPHGLDCFAEAARVTARDADIVVTNHAMLAIDALSDGMILPDHDAVIVDEAHELVDRMTTASTAMISPRGLNITATKATSLCEESSCGPAERLSGIADLLEEAFDTAKEGRWLKLSPEIEDLLDQLGEALMATRKAIAHGPDDEQTNDPEQATLRVTVANHLEELFTTVGRIRDVFDEPDPAKRTDVIWLERDRRSGAANLFAAPLDVAETLRESLFGAGTAILTSATLALGGKFDTMAKSWGLDTNEFTALDVGTPFKPEQAGILYVAKHLNPPGRDGTDPRAHDEMKELIMACGGRTLGLFSSRQAAEKAAAALRETIPFDIFLQGEGTLGDLVDQFKNQENSCLFGTLSLWQGVDVPGKTCSLVLIDRIPFARPDDPLSSARSEAATASGGNGFMDVSLAHAALLLAQGAGRLLRRIDDRGVVAVLDSRLVTKRYGHFLVTSMPPFWATTDKTKVVAALKRLAGG